MILSVNCEYPYGTSHDFSVGETKTEMLYLVTHQSRLKENNKYGSNNINIISYCQSYNKKS